METVVGVFVVAHLLGMAAILGGWLAWRLGAERGLAVLVWGARAQLLIGLILVGLNELAQEDLNNAKVAVKLVIALVVVGCAEVARVRARKGTPQPILVHAAAAAALLNVLVAVLWRAA